MDPPWHEYESRVKDLPIYMNNPEKYNSWTFKEIADLKIWEIADNPSFLFLWCGNNHKEDARALF